MKELQYLNKYFIKYKYRFLLGLLITIVAQIFSLFTPELIGNSIKVIEDYIKSAEKDVALLKYELLKNQTLMEVLHEKENAKKIFEGMISFVDKNLVGFSKGELIITGYGDFSNTKMKIIFKNEILLAYLKKTNEIEEQCVDGKESQNSSYGELVAAVPDLISILDKDSYEAILVENFSYGLKVVVVAIPSNNILRDNLELTGPKSFGYDIEYKPFSECKNPESFWNYQK